MRGEESYTARAIARLPILVGLLVLAEVAAWGQVAITSIQSSVVNGTPRDVIGITSGVQVPGGRFVMYINGSFPNAANGIPMQWLNTVTGVTFNTLAFGTPAQLQVFIPENLYLTPVQSVQPVQIILTQSVFQAIGQFYVNPPLSSPQVLPIGTVGRPYSAAVVYGGTPPYTVGQVIGTIPPGLSLNTGTQNELLSGTPTTPGLFAFNSTAIDQWNATAQQQLEVQVVGPATIGSLTPNAAAAGAGLLQITVNGANFIDSRGAAGSVVQWTSNSVTSTLATTYVSASQLRAIVPTALMAAPGVAGVSVLQPDDSITNAASFTLLSPVITSLSPPSIVAGSTLALTVNGANFADRTAATDAVGIKLPQVRFGATLLPTVFVNAATLTVAVPANLVNPPGPLTVSVVNPGGSTSNAATFTITAVLTIATQNLPGGTSGTPYSAGVTATGGSGAYTWSATGLPPGLGIDPRTGTIGGTPLSSGTFPALVRVTDGQGSSVQASFTITINLPPPTISTPSNLPGGTVGVG